MSRAVPWLVSISASKYIDLVLKTYAWDKPSPHETTSEHKTIPCSPLTSSTLCIKSKGHSKIIKNMLTSLRNKISPTVCSLLNSCMPKSLANQILATMLLPSASSSLLLLPFTIQCSSMLHDAFIWPVCGVSFIGNLLIPHCLSPPRSLLLGSQVSLTFLSWIYLDNSLAL